MTRLFNASMLRLRYRTLEPIDGPVGPAKELADKAIGLAEELESEVNDAEARAEEATDVLGDVRSELEAAERRADDLDDQVGDLKNALRTIGSYVEEAIYGVEDSMDETTGESRRRGLQEVLYSLVNARREVDDNV